MTPPEVRVIAALFRAPQDTKMLLRRTRLAAVTLDLTLAKLCRMGYVEDQDGVWRLRRRGTQVAKELAGIDADPGNRAEARSDSADG